MVIAPPSTKVNQGLQPYYADPHEYIFGTRAPRGNFAPPTGIEGKDSQLDISAFIPRTAQTIPTLLSIPGLSPSLTEGNFSEWEHTCKQHRDRAYSEEATYHFSSLTLEDGEEGSAIQHTRRKIDNQQHTQGVEYRQNNYSSHHEDNVEDEPKTE